MRNSQRRLLSQNFLLSRSLVTKLVRLTSIEKKDTVLEIGAGKGIITSVLLDRARTVIAYEIDQNLYNYLDQVFRQTQNLILKNIDFRNSTLPSQSYKIFSNIPFIITADVIKKITQANNPPEEAFLIVQKEAALKFLGTPYDNKNSQLAIQLKPFFELNILYKFEKSDFYPRPHVDSVLLHIKRKERPLIALAYRQEFDRFVIYLFNQTNPNIATGVKKLINTPVDVTLYVKPSELRINEWLNLFGAYMHNPRYGAKKKVLNFYEKYRANRNKLQKSHRTRKAH